MINFFKSKPTINEKSENISKEIAEIILKQENKLLTMHEIFEHLNPELVSWFLGMMTAIDPQNRSPKLTYQT
jgi:hypothetical protein